MNASPTDAVLSDGVPLIEFDRVSRKHGEFRFALSEVSLRAGRSELLALTGAAGAGKSTFLRLAAGLDRASSGDVRIAGQSIAPLKPAALALLRRSMGIVTEDLALLETGSVRENVSLPARLAGLARDEADRRADAALGRLGLDGEIAARRACDLSCSERQRVALARAVVNRPAILLLDQPTRGLDGGDSARIVHLLEQFAIAGVCVVVAVNDGLPMPQRARTLRLDHGRIVR